MTMQVSAIVAVSRNGIIGLNNQLPWKLPADLAYFKRVTQGHHILLGRKNYQSIGRPLPNRTNLVLTRDSQFSAPGCTLVHSMEQALEIASLAGETELFVIGGAEIYALALPWTTRLYLTRIEEDFSGDVALPNLGTGWKEVWKESHDPDERNPYSYSFLRYERVDG